jgi:hypothetical protein
MQHKEKEKDSFSWETKSCLLIGHWHGKLYEASIGRTVGEDCPTSISKRQVSQAATPEFTHSMIEREEARVGAEHVSVGTDHRGSKNHVTALLLECLNIP